MSASTYGGYDAENNDYSDHISYFSTSDAASHHSYFVYDPVTGGGDTDSQNRYEHTTFHSYSHPYIHYSPRIASM